MDFGVVVDEDGDGDVDVDEDVVGDVVGDVATGCCSSKK